ncbi:hypothetical protein OC844_002003 [Tilletia horrida]|nr:hypothetical protein OC844_002003 [Tilletia horrida]
MPLSPSSLVTWMMLHYIWAISGGTSAWSAWFFLAYGFWASFFGGGDFEVVATAAAASAHAALHTSLLPVPARVADASELQVFGALGVAAWTEIGHNAVADIIREEMSSRQVADLSLRLHQK